jgi:uncharacterized protein GlcG (DUF336 family)
MTLTLAEAHRIIEGAIAQAQELKVEISVTICDANGRLIALNRMDGAFAESNRGSIGKAIASAASGRPSGEAEASVDFSLRTGTVIGEGAPIIRRRGGLRAGGMAPKSGSHLTLCWREADSNLWSRGLASRSDLSRV